MPDEIAVTDQCRSGRNRERLLRRTVPDPGRTGRAAVPVDPAADRPHFLDHAGRARGDRLDDLLLLDVEHGQRTGRRTRGPQPGAPDARSGDRPGHPDVVAAVVEPAVDVLGAGRTGVHDVVRTGQVHRHHGARADVVGVERVLGEPDLEALGAGSVDEHDAVAAVARARDADAGTRVARHRLEVGPVGVLTDVVHVLRSADRRRVGRDPPLSDVRPVARRLLHRVEQPAGELDTPTGRRYGIGDGGSGGHRSRLRTGQHTHGGGENGQRRQSGTAAHRASHVSPSPGVGRHRKRAALSAADSRTE